MDAAIGKAATALTEDGGEDAEAGGDAEAEAETEEAEEEFEEPLATTATGWLVVVVVVEILLFFAATAAVVLRPLLPTPLTTPTIPPDRAAERGMLMVRPPRAGREGSARTPRSAKGQTPSRRRMPK